MSKYDSLKFLKETKARNSRACDKCCQGIENGEIYYKESVGKVNAPGLILRGYCARCYKEHGNKLLTGKF
jgi:hypothetical protein